MRFRSKSRETNATATNVHAPLIDVVFLLLVFFLLTLRISQPEGRFETKAPRASAAPEVPVETPPFRVRMTAHRDGSLAELRVGTTRLGNDDRAFARLHEMLLEIAPELRRDLRVAIHADPNLDYAHTLRALSSCSRYHDPATGRVETLAERVQLVRPRG